MNLVKIKYHSCFICDDKYFENEIIQLMNSPKSIVFYICMYCIKELYQTGVTKKIKEEYI